MNVPSLRSVYDFAASAPERRAGLLLAISAATIGGAWFSEYGLGYIPCKLCLLQRWPYYFGVPLAGLALVIARPATIATSRASRFRHAGCDLHVSVALGVHHAGVEWGWWAGPADCGGRISAGPSSVGDLHVGDEQDTARELHGSAVPHPRPEPRRLERGGLVPSSRRSRSAAGGTGAKPPSRLQFAVPVEVVHPALVQIVRREQPALRCRSLTVGA